MKKVVERVEETVIIEKIVSGGYGLAHLSDNKVIMIKHVLPEEKVLVSYKENKKDFCFGKLLEVIEPSPLRIDPLCPLFGSCGGCQFQMTDYETQLSIKQKIIEESLLRIGKTPLKVKPIIASEKPFYYRNKGSFQVFNQGEIGFCKPGTTFPFAVDKCYLMEDSINQKIKDLKEPEEKASLEKLKALNIRSNAKGETIDSRTKKSFFYDQVENLQFRVDVDTFFQVNRNVVPLWLEHIKDLVLPHTKGEELLDLFCGVGIIGQYLSPYFKKVIGIEINKNLIENGKKVLEINGIQNMELIEGSAEIFDDNPSIKDTIIINPPRTGIPDSMIEKLILKKPPIIIYSSCNPDTFARDIGNLIHKGNYHANDIQPFDMFPQTHHTEIVTILYQEKS